MIRIAYDTGPLKSGDAVRGIGFHSSNLLKHLKGIKGIDVEPVDIRFAKQSRFDIFHYQKFHPYFLSIPLVKKGKEILTIHDLIYLRYPDKYPSGLKGKIRFWLQKLLIKRIDEIITISETSKKDIVRFLGIASEKVHVVYLAPREIFRKLPPGGWEGEIRKRYSLPEKFVLYVGDVNYNKNILVLCRACKLVKIPLVIAGKQAKSEDFDREHPENKPLVELLEKYGEDKDIIRLGFVPDEDLVGIYNLATLYCQPSLYEGFGLPVLEAFSSGCPVVCSNTQALVEIAKPAALFANPQSPKDFADKFKQIIKDGVLREQLIATGKVAVKKYSWEKTAKETARIYEKLYQGV